MTLGQFLTNLNNVVVGPALTLLFGVAFVIFVWGIVEYIRDSGSEAGEGRETGKRSMIWGLVGMIIMVSVYGIIQIIYGTLGVDTSKLPQNPNEPYLPESYTP